MMLFIDCVALVFVSALIVRGVARVAEEDWLAGTVEPSLRLTDDHDQS